MLLGALNEIIGCAYLTFLLTLAKIMDTTPKAIKLNNRMIETAITAFLKFSMV